MKQKQIKAERRDRKKRKRMRVHGSGMRKLAAQLSSSGAAPGKS